jgi:hypothetical protein
MREGAQDVVAVQSVIRQDNGWTVSAGYQTDQFDAVIIATPTHAAADRFASADEQSRPRSGRDQVQFFGDRHARLRRKSARSLPPGFGFLVPRSEGHRMLAATFVHNKFPHRAPENRALVRCFLGGARDEQILQASEEEILQSFAPNCGRSSAHCRTSVCPRLQMEVGHGAIFRRPPRALAAHRSAPPEVFPAWRSRAMAITASAFPTAFAPAPKQPAKSSPRWGCGRWPS